MEKKLGSLLYYYYHYSNPYRQPLSLSPLTLDTNIQTKIIFFLSLQYIRLCVSIYLPIALSDFVPNYNFWVSLFRFCVSLSNYCSFFPPRLIGRDIGAGHGLHALNSLPAFDLHA